MDELIHKLYLIKFINCDIYLDIVFCIKNKYLQLIYDKIILIADDNKLRNIIDYYWRIKEHYNVSFNLCITSECDAINSCQQCQYINNFIKRYGNQRVELVRNNDIIRKFGYYRLQVPFSCNNYNLLIHDPNKILLVFNCHTYQPDYNIHFLEKYGNLIDKKYICLTDLIYHCIDISKETFKDSFSYSIRMESSIEENNTINLVKIKIRH